MKQGNNPILHLLIVWIVVFNRAGAINPSPKTSRSILLALVPSSPTNHYSRWNKGSRGDTTVDHYYQMIINKAYRQAYLNMNPLETDPSKETPPSSSSSSSSLITPKMEQEVWATSRAKMDWKRVQNVILDDNDDYDQNRQLPRTLLSGTNYNPNPEQHAILASPWNVALAAATTAAIATQVVTNNVMITLLVFPMVFYLALGDPIEQDGIMGSLARVLGRFTIEKVETTKPKLQAIARAAVLNDDQILDMQRQLRTLQTECEELTLWKQRRLAIDQHESQYTIKELKEMARQNNLPIGGKKQELMMRLLQDNVLQLDCAKEEEKKQGFENGGAKQ